MVTETYNIYFNQYINSVVMEWDGYATSAEFKEGTELMLNRSGIIHLKC